MSNTNDVTCIMNLEIQRKDMWNFHSMRRMENLPWDQVKEKGNGLPGDVSRPVLNSYNYDYRTFAVFGESSVLQKHLKRFGYSSKSILKETEGDQLRLVVWYRSWKIQPEE